MPPTIPAHVPKCLPQHIPAATTPPTTAAAAATPQCTATPEAALEKSPVLCTGMVKSSDPPNSCPFLVSLSRFLYSCDERPKRKKSQPVSNKLVKKKKKKESPGVWVGYKATYGYGQDAPADLGPVAVAREVARGVVRLEGELAHSVRALALPVCRV